MKNITLLGLLTLLVSFNVFGQEWEKTLEKDGITVYKKDSRESDIQSLKAQGIVRASVEQITTLLRDVDNSTKWVPNLLTRKVVENISDTEAILYDVTDMPWPITDRDTVVHHKLFLAENKLSLILKFESASNRLREKSDDHVRAKIQTGYLKFVPQGEHSLVEMFILVDPKGSIPSWAVNIVQVSMPYDFLRALDKFAGKHKLVTPPGIKKLVSQVIRIPNT